MDTDVGALKEHFVVETWEASDRVPHLCPGLTYSDETNDNTAKESVAHGSVRWNAVWDCEEFSLWHQHLSSNLGQGPRTPPSLLQKRSESLSDLTECGGFIYLGHVIICVVCFLEELAWLFFASINFL